MSGWHNLWHFEFLGNELAEWTVALAIFLITFTLLPLVKRFIARERRRLPPTTTGYFWLDLAAEWVTHTRPLFIWGLAVWLASRDLNFPPRFGQWLTVVLVVVFWVQMAIWVMTAVRHAIELRRQRSIGPDTLLKSSMEVILFATGILVWGMAVLFALDTLGVQIQPLLAGVGIGGIALALAVQTVLGDLLASLSIALDKPFGLGDFLTLDDCQGTVEHIGVKSTRLRSISGEQIIISNGDLLKARVRNWGRLRERRALFQLDLHYDTPVATLAAVPRAVREIVEGTPDTRFDRCHLLRCTDKALQFEVVYFVLRPEFGAYADAQQSINLRILERFRAMEIRFIATAPMRLRLERPVTQPPTDGGGQQRLL
jgi:small-conductance mechanosensitive channel